MYYIVHFEHDKFRFFVRTHIGIGHKQILVLVLELDVGLGADIFGDIAYFATKKI